MQENKVIKIGNTKQGVKSQSRSIYSVEGGITYPHKYGGRWEFTALYNRTVDI
jgi:hypothetical protein